MASLFVTVLVVDALTAVSTKTVPVTAGIVTVFVPATAVGDNVIVPEVDPARAKFPITTQCSKLNRQEL